jgi:hypothetical protein
MKLDGSPELNWLWLIPGTTTRGYWLKGWIELVFWVK